MADAKAMAQALEMFEAQGIKVTKEMREALVKAQQSEMREAAETIFARRLVNDGLADHWTEEMFTLSETIHADFKPEERNVQGRGTGTRTVRSFAIETPNGRLRVELSE